MKAEPIRYCKADLWFLLLSCIPLCIFLIYCLFSSRGYPRFYFLFDRKRRFTQNFLRLLPPDQRLMRVFVPAILCSRLQAVCHAHPVAVEPITLDPIHSFVPPISSSYPLVFHVNTYACNFLSSLKDKQTTEKNLPNPCPLGQHPIFLHS